jgi:hypothetical protein
MTTVNLSAPVPVEAVDPTSFRVAIRVAVVRKLAAGALPFSPTLAYRPTRRPIALPAVTFFDSGTRTDPTVPLSDRNLQLNIWARSDLDQAEAIADRVEQLLDHQPLILPGEEGQVAYIALTADVDAPMDDADVVRKTLTFRVLAYQWNGAQPFTT